MSATWRREDYGYGAAALAAAAFLLYLVFGNFGLLPSPIAGASPEVGTYAIGSVDAISGVDAAPITRVPDVSPTVPAAPPPPVADRTAPKVGITTESGTKISVAEPAVVEGFATDAASGIEAVSVTFETDTDSTKIRAKLDCNARNLSCTWTASVPAIVGEFTVTASAADGAGNKVRSDAITITVVNPSGPVGEVVGGVGQTVSNVPSTISQVVGGLIGLLGGS
ncbi:MAG: Ig-like domain repeat protein [Actinomycetota bacterium]